MAGYPIELWDSILDRIGRGEMWARISREPGMPTQDALYKRMEDNADFKNRYEVALLRRADALVEENMGLIQDLLESDDVTLCKDCQTAVNQAKVSGARQAKKVELAVKNNQWLAERLDPRRYGAAVKVEHDDKRDGFLRVLRDAQPRIRQIAATEAKVLDVGEPTHKVVPINGKVS